MINDAQVHPAGTAPQGTAKRRKFKRQVMLPLLMVLPLALSTGCSNMPKETSLSMGGALAGAAVGAQHDGLRGAMVGALIGGFLGNRIGAHLDEEDKKKLAELETKSLDSGKPMTFITNKTKATITLTPEPAKDEAVKSFKVATGVELYQLRTVPPHENPAFVDTPVFIDTNDAASPAAIIKKGDPINIVATVEGRNDWAAVIDTDVVVGYVPMRYLDQKIVKLEQSAKAKAAKLQEDKAKAAKLQEAKDREVKRKQLAAAKAAKARNAKATAVPPPIPVATVPLLAAKPQLASGPAVGTIRLVTAMSICKTVTRTIDTGKKDESFTESVKYCQDPPPKWKTIT